jgi:predicted kinase
MERPKLIILCGIPGSGKTYYAERYVKTNPDTIHLSSDAIRKELWGDEATQGDNNQVFSLMQSRAIEALNNGQSVVYDATSITRKDRSYIISLCPKFVHIECHVIWAPIETCIERDAVRERTVGKEVIDRMLKRFQPPYYDEDIDEIKVIWNTNKDFNPHAYVTNLINASNIPHDNPHHTLNIKEHCDEAYRYAINNLFPSYLIMAAKYHDIGKPYVKAFVDGRGNLSEHAHYYQHQCISSWMYYGIDKYNFKVAWLISVHMDPFLNTKYYNRLPAYLKKQVDLLHEADLAAH